MLSKDSIASILRAGGNVRIAAMSKETLLDLAAIARSVNVRLEIVGSMPPETCIDVARAGGGNVLFDISGK